MREQSAVALIELLAVLAVLAVLVATLGITSWHGRPSLGEAAALVRSGVASSRMSAIAAGKTVVVSGHGCITSGLGWPDYPFSLVTTWPPRGLLFTPDGLPRTCDGGGVGNTTILLEHRGRQAAVIVSSLGRVRWELR